MKQAFKKIQVNGKTLTARVGADFRFDSLSDAGWISITSIGEENIYFKFTDATGDELSGFCKCL